jgi:hypothetical protein
VAIAHVGTTTSGANQTTTCTLTLNFTTEAGDLLIYACTNGGADADPTIGGTMVTTGGVSWAKFHSLGGGATTDLNGSVWWARATGDHNTQTIVASGFTNSSAGCVGAVRNALPTGTPIVNANSVLNASGTNTLGAVSTVGTGCWILVTLHTDDNIASDTVAAATSPTTVTIRREHLSAGGNDTGATLCYAAHDSSGTTGDFSWNNGRGAGIYQIAIAGVILPDSQTITGVVGPTVTVTAGTGTVTPGAVTISPTGPTVSVTAGTATVTGAAGDTTIADVVGPTVAITPGTPAVTQTIVDAVGPTVSVTAGTPALALTVTPEGPTVAITPGTPALQLAVTPEAPTVTITPGTGTVTPGAVTVAAEGPTVTVTAGTATVADEGAEPAPAVEVEPARGGSGRRGPYLSEQPARDLRWLDEDLLLLD